MIAGARTPEASERQTLVEQLRDAIMVAEGGLDVVAETLKRVLVTEAWRDREVRGERVTFERFEDFVKTKWPRGLGTRLDRIETIVGHDGETLRLFRKAIVMPGPKTRAKLEDSALRIAARLDREDSDADDERASDESNDNVILDEPTARGQGNSRAYALDRLERDAPEIYQEVVSGAISAHAAMLKAGLKKAPDGLSVLKKSWAKATETERDDFVAWLRAEGEIR